MKTILRKAKSKRGLKEYISILRETGHLLEFGKYIFDIKSLFYTSYACMPEVCLKKSGGYFYGSCCTDYIVDISAVEKKKIEKMLVSAKNECEKNFGWVLKEKIFKKDRKGRFYLAHRKNNTCALSVVKDGLILCVIDLLAEKYGLKRTEYKPSVCFSWPLDCIKAPGDKIFVTVINSGNGGFLKQNTGELKCVSGSCGNASADSLSEQLEKYLGQKDHAKLIKMYRGHNTVPVLKAFR
jgi:hypothetical protein